MDYLDSIISGFKRTLNLHDNNYTEDDHLVLDNDIKKYVEIINSNKYADSNSNTEALQKLLSAMQEVNKSDQQTKEKGNETEDLNPEQDEEIQDHDKILKQYVPMTLAFGKEGFKERLQKHKLLLEDYERDSLFMPGQPVHRKGGFGQTLKLPLYRIPLKIFDALEKDDTKVLNLNTQINIQTYVNKFQKLLWVEEAHQAIEMHRYDLCDQMIGKCKQTGSFELEVPGLAEKRPSLIRGDRLLLTSRARSTKYEGFIHDVREKTILFKIHQSIQHLDGLRFDVSFMSSRTTFRRCHYAIENYNRSCVIRSIVFPKSHYEKKNNLILVKDNEDHINLRCFMRQLNEYQRKAVINILKGQCRPAPYIVFGPPGTGKTVTMVEAILQVYVRNPNSNILVCGNSNSCADLIAQRLKFSGVIEDTQKIARLSAFYRMEKLIPEDIEDITYDADMLDGNYDRFRIIVTTCIQSGVLYNYQQKYDYVFIDEAGHANEPEIAISIGLVNMIDGCVVLVGDHKQLGPVVISKLAKYSGLGTSMLERLSRLPIYQRKSKEDKIQYDEKYITKLIISYRSDARVLKVSNKLFYDDELKFVITTPQKWLDLLKVPKPLIFHPVKGRDRREYINPSWFNANEAIKVIFYVYRLYSAGLKPNQLGIITPYRRQIDKIMLLFDRCNLEYCKIATMEEFQGDEREVIIISTVRASEKNIKFDEKYNLGFLFDDKRFNVAVTRAKWLCIVVGDPRVLKKDPCWVEFIEEAHNIPEDIVTDNKTNELPVL